jgi:hypothetical protein
MPGAPDSRESMTRRALFFQELQHNLNTMPEVASVGIFNPIPFSANAVRAIQISTGVSNARREDPERVSALVIAGYANPEGFDMLDVSLIVGRHFSSIDMTNEIEFQSKFWDMEAGPYLNTAGGVVIVNQSLARQFWPEENAVGKMIYDMFFNAYEIIGVARDFHQVSDNKDFVPAVYYPPDSWRTSQTFLVRLHSGAFMQDFRRRLSGFDAGPVTIEVSTLGETVSESMANTRMTLQLLGSFALLGFVVAGLGVYATTSLMMAAMNREMGIRMAMGAQIWDILRLALWRGTRAIIIGLPLGLFLAWILSRTLSSYLFQVKDDDPLAWIVSCAALIGITIIAAFIPALRAAFANPADILRKE